MLVLVGGVFLVNISKSLERESLRFSNTQTWDPHLLQRMSEAVYYVPNWKDVVVLDTPPSNTSSQTKRELEQLILLKSLRTDERIKKIKSEVFLSEIKIGDYMYTDYLDYNQFPKTAMLLQRAYDDLDIILLQYKKKFDRVRPSFLELSIVPLVDVPQHAAYPSGHSTQVHFLAYVLGELAVDRRSEFELDAWEVATNREIAGVHYRSDTEAGRTLARQFVDILLKNVEFKKLMVGAQSEWKLN